MSGSIDARTWWAILSWRSWDRMALAKLVEEAGFEVSVSTVPSAAALDRLAQSEANMHVILAVGPEDLESRGIAALIARCGTKPVVVFARDGCEDRLPKPLPRNVVGVLTDAMEETIAAAMLTVAASGFRVVADPDAPADRDRGPKDGVQTLTSREKEISHEICRGVSNKEIARKLGIAVNTVNVHATSIRRKLGVRNRTQVAMHFLKASGSALGAAAADADRIPAASRLLATYPSAPWAPA